MTAFIIRRAESLLFNPDRRVSAAVLLGLLRAGVLLAALSVATLGSI